MSYPLANSKRIRSFACSVLLILLICTMPQARAEDCSDLLDLLHDKGYGSWSGGRAKSVDMIFGNKVLTFARLKRYTFSNPGNYMGNYGTITALCQDNKSIGVTIELSQPITEAQFRARVSPHATRMACDDSSAIARAAKEAIPGLTTCGVYRKDDSFIYLTAGQIINYINVPSFLQGY